jgi:hypothetical protein
MLKLNFHVKSFAALGTLYGMLSFLLRKAKDGFTFRAFFIHVGLSVAVFITREPCAVFYRIPKLQKDLILRAALIYVSRQRTEDAPASQKKIYEH